MVPHSTDKVELEGRNVFSKVGFTTEEVLDQKINKQIQSCFNAHSVVSPSAKKRLQGVTKQHIAEHTDRYALSDVWQQALVACSERTV